jgi:predicted enzyme related to lactoylglutathione lyase
MNTGVHTLVYPATDLDQSKAIFEALLGVAPYVDSPYYVGFRVGDQEVGLDPNGHREGAVPYWDVDDIKATMAGLLDAGAETVREPSDVGGGKLVATMKDPGGNLIGLTQNP